MALNLVFNHLVLPPRLPERRDQDPESVSNAILCRLFKACKFLRDRTIQKQGQDNLTIIWLSVLRTLAMSNGIHRQRLEAVQLVKRWADLQSRDLHIIYLAEQNAALLIRRTVTGNEGKIVFEGFEASPSAKHVLAAEGALRWDFPGRAVSIPQASFCNASFQKNLARFLEQAASESLQCFAARTQKAGTSVIETRDTTDPALLFSFLMPFLAADGEPISVTALMKRVRDDVHIDTAELPWRRNPAWLVLRVALQRHLIFTLGAESGRLCYKFLICTVLAHLLEDCVGRLPSELVLTLRAKLCRRLAKLNVEQMSAPEQGSKMYKELSDSIGDFFQKTIQTATFQVENAWKAWKRDNIRRIPELPLRAPEAALKITLPASGDYLRSLLQVPPTFRQRQLSLALPPLDNLKATMTLTKTYFKFAQLDLASEHRAISTTEPQNSYAGHCIEQAEAIQNLFTAAYSICISKPLEMSSFILNVFERWVAMDKCAVIACPVLVEFQPPFPPKALDVLLLSTFADMQRLQLVQMYLQKRYDACVPSKETIFGAPSDTAFATRYLAGSNDAQNLQQLLSRIMDDSRTASDCKEGEWRRACEQYDTLSAKIAAGTCVCSLNSDGTRNVRGCTRCWHWRTRKNMRIDIHEEYLPDAPAQRAALVFELSIPRYLQLYRNITWKIFKELGHPGRPIVSISPAKSLLKDQLQLEQYAKSTARGISLASVCKSFRQTHYQGFKMRVDLKDIILRQAASFAYYDLESKLWVEDLQKEITFAHHCRIHVPEVLLSVTLKPPDHPPQKPVGPTSYETVASQTKCPLEGSVHEFTALQRLLAGNNRRWITMLVELGSSNVNFSAEDTMLLYNHLAIQAGPMQYIRKDPLRDVHIIFRSRSFCQRLIERIEHRLQIVKSNWRESYCMELLLTLTLRLYELTNGETRQSAVRILEHARIATLDWIVRLRDEMQTTTDNDSAVRIANYGLWAALLCRRTFIPLADADNRAMSAEELSIFIQASLALQDNLVVDLSKMSTTVASVFMRDMKAAYRMSAVLKTAIFAHPLSLTEAINRSWSGSQSSSRHFSSWQFLADPHGMWIVAIMLPPKQEQEWSQKQVVHYSILEGYLFVDGMPLGRLPLESLQSDQVKQLFGNQHLLAFPSPVQGMSHVLAKRFARMYEIHIGRRGNDVVIRAFGGGAVYEYVPADVFRDDLPVSLLENCTHWLNLVNGLIEVRRRPYLWTTRDGDWTIDLHRREAIRRGSRLVDPYSPTHRQIRRIFQDFEDPQHLTVFQPKNGHLQVELKRKQLSFFVNSKALLQCRQIHAEVDPNQDAGTLYGFCSKLVMRDVANRERRNLFVALGTLQYIRRGMHVAVQVGSTAEYGIFEIDNILGRLTCLPEPRLLYTKALLHAVTSFALPDPLTASTGTEEAYHVLRSGCCQPWKPLDISSNTILNEFAAFTPSREYYPPDKTLLQTVRWNSNLTTTIQHDCLGPAVEEIFRKSGQLDMFNDPKKDETKQAERGPNHLQRRGLLGRRRYERHLSDIVKQELEKDDVYQSFNRSKVVPQEQRVFHVANLVHQPFGIETSIDYGRFLQNLPGKFIGGFHNTGETQTSLSHLVGNELGEQWGSLVNFARRSSPDDRYQLAFRLAFLAFSPTVSIDAIKLLCAFSSLEDLRNLEPPPHPTFVEFNVNRELTCNRLKQLINPNVAPQGSRNSRTAAQLSRLQVTDPKQIETERLATYLLQQWPSEHPSTLSFDFEVLDKDEVMERVVPEWTRLYANLQLLKYAQAVQEILDRQPMQATIIPTLRQWSSNVRCPREANHGPVLPSLPFDLMLKPSPESSLEARIERKPLVKRTTVKADVAGPAMIAELNEILSTFVRSPKQLWQQYGSDLLASLDSLRHANMETSEDILVPNLEEIDEQIKIAREAVSDRFRLILQTFSDDDLRFQWLREGQLWPIVTPVTVLEQLRSNIGRDFGHGTKELLVSYGMLITTLQWLLRVRHQLLKRDEPRALEEWGSQGGHKNWDPLQHPDWLLFEIDGNLLLRSEQVEVANAIIAPPSLSNSVFQLNMGKGKTSCIVPVALTSLANTKQLARLIVPKALLRHTAQTLQAKIGGLVGREIIHMPFSRRTRTTPELLKLYANLHRQMMSDHSGVILTVPEHILSFKLSGFQRLADSKIDQAQEMIEFQNWLEANCRDVLDECDVSLAVKTQLIYPSGQLTPVDGHPDRWIIAQALLQLVCDHLVEVSRLVPSGLEIIHRNSGFPTVHFLQTKAEDVLRDKIVDAICNGTSIIRVPQSITSDQKAMLQEVLCAEWVKPETFKTVFRGLRLNSAGVKKVLLIRGLITNKILLLCLKKRWHVQYGFHPKRHPIAVPFEAKGVPSEQAEFGHPDVAILFTCLAFYYSGLLESQLKDSLDHVLRSDDPASEYDRWTANCRSLPDALRHWNVINVDDAGQILELWRHLRFNTTVLNHYMNIFVFPQHAKQFTIKLQSSAWDLPLLSSSFDVVRHKSASDNTRAKSSDVVRSESSPDNNCGKSSDVVYYESSPDNNRAKTTGFSGTNDNRRLLPLTIKQEELPSLSQTNAEVLTYLLQDRNREYIVAADHRGVRLSEKQLLETIAFRGVRVFIDAGASILELGNRSLVQQWLKIDSEPQAAVYFDNEDNRAWVQFRTKPDAVPLLATPFADNLEGCLIYLDEAHTRGTDLKLPPAARGAITLALGQTKDHTVQAAMRLRQLATTQSVVFFAPPEVHQSILDVCKKTPDCHVDSSDVVRWLLEQTCLGNEQLQLLYTAQGLEFCRRSNAAREHSDIHDSGHRSSLLKAIELPERLTLEEQYGVGAEKCRKDLQISHPALKHIAEELNEKRDAVEHLNLTTRTSAMEEVEQEREVEFQVQETREVQRPTHHKALKFPGLHPDIENFVRVGYLEGHVFKSFLSFLAQTACGKKHRLPKKSSNLFLSHEFTRTVKLPTLELDDNFLRPVEYVLWSPSTNTGLVIIPEEAELLIPILRTITRPRLHLIAYAAPTTKNMLHFCRLDYYVLPRFARGYKLPVWLGIELGILGARVYFTFEEYGLLKEYFGGNTESGGQEGSVSMANWVGFLAEWLTIRRKSQDISMTPMGYLCQGKALHAEHPFFKVAVEEKEDVGQGLRGEVRTAVEEEVGEPVDDDEDDYEDE